jgi:hypothetical protein
MMIGRPTMKRVVPPLGLVPRPQHDSLLWHHAGRTDPYAFGAPAGIR